MKNRTAILARVSKTEQSTDRQVSEMGAYAEAKGFEVVATFRESISGATANADRPIIQEVLKLATTKKIDRLLVHEVSRLGRNTSEVLALLEQLHKLKISVSVLSYQLETLNLDGSVNSMAQFLFTILADVARMERATLIDRINSGLAEAKRQGKHLGRKAGTKDSKEALRAKYKKVLAYLDEGMSVRETAKLCDISPSTIVRLKQKLT